MNGKQALKRLTALLGPRAAIRDNQRPSSPEAREYAKQQRIAGKDARDAAEAAMNARRDALLAGDAEYQRLRAAFQKARTEYNAMPSQTYHRYTAGTSGSLFFSVAAEADTIDELVAKVEAKQRAA